MAPKLNCGNQKRRPRHSRVRRRPERGREAEDRTLSSPCWENTCRIQWTSKIISRAETIGQPGEMITFCFYTSFYTGDKNGGKVSPSGASVETLKVPAKEGFVRFNPSGAKWVQEAKSACERDALPTELRPHPVDMQILKVHIARPIFFASTPLFHTNGCNIGNIRADRKQIIECFPVFLPSRHVERLVVCETLFLSPQWDNFRQRVPTA